MACKDEDNCMVTYIFMLLTLLTIPIYLLLMALLIKYREQFKSAFFRFFVSTGVADIWLIVHKTALMTIPRMFDDQGTKQNALMATMAKAGIWYIYFAQVLGVFFMTTNRATALIFPGYHKELWTKRFQIVCIVLQWLLPLPSVIPMLHPRCRSHYEAGMYPVFDDRDVHNIYFTIDMILEPGFFACSFVLMYSMMLYKIIKFRKNTVAPALAAQKSKASIQPKPKPKPKKPAEEKAENVSLEGPPAASSVRTAEVQLFLTGVLIAATYVCMCGSYIGFYLDNHSPAVVFTFLYGSDIFTIINPWALLIFSPSVRERMLDLLFCYGSGDFVSTFHPGNLL